MTFTVPGPPIPKERPRAGRGGRFYTPPRTQAYESKVKLCALAAGLRPISGNVLLVVDLYFPDNRRRDADNCLKAIADALNGVGYRDDTQVTDWGAKKRVDAANPRAEVTIEPAG